MKRGSNFEWNFYSYNVVNVISKVVVYETDDLENARAYLRMVVDGLKNQYRIQQIHSVARFIS